MTSIFKTSNANIIICLALFSFMAGLISCEDPGSVGEQFSDQNSEVIQDTLPAGPLDSIHVTSRSGGKPFSTAGIYSDQLFGNYEAIALIQPGIGDIPVDTIANDIRVTTMRLDIIIDQSNIWGDTLSTVDYQLVEIAERWDESDWRFADSPSLTTKIVGEFSHQQADTVRVPLDSDWVERYINAFNMEPEMRDSTLAKEIFGFAVVPKNSGKLLPIDIDDTRLHINTTTTANELNQVIRQNATSLDRDQSPVFTDNGFELSSTLNNSVAISVDNVINNLRSPILSAAFLALKQNDSLLASSLPENHIRPSLNQTRLFLSTAESVVDILKEGNRNRIGTVIPESPDNPRLEINITNNLQRFISNPDSTVNIYLVYGSGNGLIRSSLYFGKAHREFPPSIFITGLEP